MERIGGIEMKQNEIKTAIEMLTKLKAYHDRLNKNQFASLGSSGVSQNGVELVDALEIALFAIEKQFQEETNEPLTLDELEQMDGEPVYLVRVEANQEKYNTPSTGWYINSAKCEEVNRSFKRITYKSIFDGMVNTIGGCVKFGYNAYKFKPKEAE